MQVLQNQNVGFGLQFQGWLSSLCPYGDHGRSQGPNPMCRRVECFTRGVRQQVRATLPAGDLEGEQGLCPRVLGRGGGVGGALSCRGRGQCLTLRVSGPRLLGVGRGWKGHLFREPCPPVVQSLQRPSEALACPACSVAPDFLLSHVCPQGSLHMAEP